jgi:formylglycine-generating enzyme required for sulfatase activity
MKPDMIPRRRFWPALLIALGNAAARKIAWLMAAMALLQTAFGAVLIWIFVLLQIEAGGTYEPGMILLSLGALLSVAAVILALLMLAWVYRSYADLRERGMELPWSPAYAAGCWLIPIVNLYRPYQIMADLWCATRLTGSSRATRSSLIGLWWGSLLASFGLFLATRLLEILGLKFQDSPVISLLVMDALFSTLALVLGSVIVRRLEADLRRTENGSRIEPVLSGLSVFLPSRKRLLRVAGGIILVVLLVGGGLALQRWQAAREVASIVAKMQTTEAQCHNLALAGEWDAAYPTCVNYDNMNWFKDKELIAVIEARHKYFGHLGKIFQDCAACPQMIAIAPGRFRMGDPSGSGKPGARPTRSISIAYPFAAGIYEVTQAQWDACVADVACQRLPEDENWKLEHSFDAPTGDGWRQWRPLSNASWDDARAYVQWLSRKTGQPYRLLSEAEWEYTARAGSQTRYPWGDQPDHEHAHYGVGYPDGAASGAQRWKSAAPVGMFAPNSFGVHDLHGNLWEWVEDCGERGTVTAPLDGRAWTRQGHCATHVLRGGAWNSTADEIRSASRMEFMTDFQMYGFRVARTL